MKHTYTITKPFLLLIALVLFGFLAGHAQDASTAEKNNASYFKFTGTYLTNSVYYGRKDSLALPYLTPSIGYYDKSGFYISGSLSYLNSKDQKGIDYTAIDLGYSFSDGNYFSGDVYANKSWYKQSSSNIKSDIKGSIGSLVSYDLNALQINAGVDLTFASKTDIGLNLGLSHSFLFGPEDNQFSIEPSFTTNWSSLHSYEGYVSRKAVRKPGAILPGGASVSAVTTVQNNKITLLDFELWVPFTYTTKKIGFTFTPTLSIPKNPIYTTTTITTKSNSGQQSSVVVNSTPQSEINLTTTFYAELGFFIKF
jgi:hypothetical protein